MLTELSNTPQILNAIQSHYGEAVIRARFTDYVQRFVRIASRFEEDGGGSKTTIGYPSSNFSSTAMRLGGGVVFVDDAQMQREMQSNVGRVEGWKLTKSYKQYQKVSCFGLSLLSLVAEPN